MVQQHPEHEVSEAPTESIAQELEPLLPMFLDNARNDVQEMRKALAENRIIDVQRTGHSLKGAGMGYGFQGLGALGKAVEQEAAGRGDAEILQKLFDKTDT
jgi:HPt (histidine-containing phosphotransfer) domain-containing protein